MSNIKCTKLRKELIGKQVKSNKGFNGQIIDVAEEACFVQSKVDLTLTLKLNNDMGEKKVALFTALERNSIYFTEFFSKEALEEFEVESKLLEEEKLKQEEEKQLELQRKREEELALIEKKKFEEKLRKTEADLDSKIKIYTNFTDSNWYEALGFLTKYGAKVRAAMPDVLESWFIRHFGDVPRYVVDSKKRTSGGFPMQWALSLSISISKKATIIPVILQDRINNKQNKIDSVSFVHELVDKYGFEIGEKPNYDKIFSAIPNEYRDSFIRGYNI